MTPAEMQRQARLAAESAYRRGRGDGVLLAFDFVTDFMNRAGAGEMLDLMVEAWNRGIAEADARVVAASRMERGYMPAWEPDGRVPPPPPRPGSGDKPSNE